VRQLLAEVPRFELEDSQTILILREVVKRVKQWEDLATPEELGFTPLDLKDFAPAFENKSSKEAELLI
jgi:hypothetical protein